MRVLGVFALVLAMARPALAGPSNSTIGGKRLTTDMAHAVGTGYPSTFYEWWNRGPRSLDWALSGELVYGEWAAAYSRGRFIRIGFGLGAPLRWHLSTKARRNATNHVAFRFTPGILLAGNREGSFTFGIKAEAAAPVSIDFRKRVNFVTGGTIPFAIYINNRDVSTFGVIPLLVRLGVEVKTKKNAAPFVLFELGPGIRIRDGNADVDFAWRLWAGTSFWGVTGK